MNGLRLATMLLVRAWGGARRVATPGLVLACLVGGAAAQQAPQAGDRTVPKSIYYLSFPGYYAGDYKQALKNFESAAKSGYNSTEGRWIDSICYFTMQGECYYHSGDLPRALESYEAALKMYLTFRDWMVRTEFPDQPLSSLNVGARDAITWGASTRKSSPGRFPDKVMIRQGRLDNETVAKQGGIIAPPQLIPINPTEISRCTALAIRRRGQLLGPYAAQDSLLAEVIDALAKRPALAAHWSTAWIDCQLGLAYAATDRPAQAAQSLQASLQAAGQWDHPLTGYALLELGKLAFAQQKYPAALVAFHEASISAAYYNDADTMEEAFRWGYTTYAVTNKKNIFPPLAAASLWARQHDLRNLQASLGILAVENYCYTREPEKAALALEEARRAMNRTDLALADTGARFNYAAAQLEALRGNVAGSNTALDLALNYQKRGSLRLFQIELVDRLYAKGAFSSDRVAEQLFETVLRDPSSDDWAVDPLDAVSLTAIPHLAPFEHWFDTALKRRNVERAIEISDYIRRHRFYSTLPLGGRLLSLRWILEAPKEALNEKMLRQRLDLFDKYPHYAAVSRKAQDLRTQLVALPLATEDANAARKYEDLLKQFGQVSQQQEAMLREIALYREPSLMVFPPALSFKDFQKQLPPGRLVLSYLITARGSYVFALSNDKYSQWPFDASTKMQKDAGSILKQWGQFERNAALENGQLEAAAWKPSSRLLLDQLLGKPKTDFWNGIEEVVIVPDGPLWYVPFEALHIGSDGESKPLISQCRVRYAPTISLTLPDNRGQKPLARTAVVLGKLFPRDDDAVAAQQFERLKGSSKETFAFKTSLPGAGRLLAALCDTLVVYDDIDGLDRGHYEWAPMQLDNGKPGSTLGSWMTTPFGGPSCVVLPGFHTEAENSLKRTPSGQEVFLTVCGFMASGTRTVLLTRWRSGGASSYDLVREFLQELPHTSAANAWQRSVELLRASQLTAENEPRLKVPSNVESVKGEHPFFWAGFMLVDTGAAPPSEKPGAAAADVEPVPAAHPVPAAVKVEAVPPAKK